MTNEKGNYFSGTGEPSYIAKSQLKKNNKNPEFSIFWYYIWLCLRSDLVESFTNLPTDILPSLWWPTLVSILGLKTILE